MTDAKTTGKAGTIHFVGGVEPREISVSELSERGSFDVVNTETGQVLQGHGANGDMRFSLIPNDALPDVKLRTRAEFQSKGYAQVDTATSKIACPSLPGAEVWAITRQQHERLATLEREREAERQAFMRQKAEEDQGKMSQGLLFSSHDRKTRKSLRIEKEKE